LTSALSLEGRFFNREAEHHPTLQVLRVDAGRGSRVAVVVVMAGCHVCFIGVL
jgi:hypothetical protein